MRSAGNIFNNPVMEKVTPSLASSAPHDAVMGLSLQQLQGKHARFERELAAAFGTRPWPAALIERLSDELQATESEIGALQSA